MLRLETTKHVRLNASHSGSFFQDLYNQYQDYDGLDIAFDNYPDAVLDMAVTQDSLEIKLHSKSKVLLHFEAYYIEDDEYGDALYDVYTQDEEEEGLPEVTVGSMLDDWFTDLRRRIGLRDEDDESVFLENRSAMNPMVAKLKYLFSKILRTVDPKDVEAALRKQIDPDSLRLLLSIIANNVLNRLEDEASSNLCKLIDCQYQEGSKQGRIQVTYEIFGKQFKKAIGVLGKLEKEFYKGAYPYFKLELRNLDYLLEQIEKGIVGNIKAALTKAVTNLWTEYAEGIFNPDSGIIANPNANWYINLFVYATMPIKPKELKIPDHIVGTQSGQVLEVLDAQHSQELLDLPYKGSTLRNFISRDPSIFDKVYITVRRRNELIFKIVIIGNV